MDRKSRRRVAPVDIGAAFLPITVTEKDGTKRTGLGHACANQPYDVAYHAAQRGDVCALRRAQAAAQARRRDLARLVRVIDAALAAPLEVAS